MDNATRAEGKEEPHCPKAGKTCPGLPASELSLISSDLADVGHKIKQMLAFMEEKLLQKRDKRISVNRKDLKTIHKNLLLLQQYVEDIKERIDNLWKICGVYFWKPPHGLTTPEE